MITHLRAIELSVPDVTRTAEFYQLIWGLDEVGRRGETIYLRARGSEHYVLALHQGTHSELRAIRFGAADARSVNILHDRASAAGAQIEQPPHTLEALPGGGYGFELLTPERHRISIAAEVAPLPILQNDRSLPWKLSHIVLNTQDCDAQLRFFIEVLGFRLTDSNERMEFLRCNADHHAIALARRDCVGVNHTAYEMTDFDGLMRGVGRLVNAGVALEWGVGRHGAGDNIYSYFVDPNGFVSEYTVEIEQIDETVHVRRTKEYWDRAMNGHPDQWKMSRPSERMIKAMSGQLLP